MKPRRCANHMAAYNWGGGTCPGTCGVQQFAWRSETFCHGWGVVHKKNRKEMHPKPFCVCFPWSHGHKAHASWKSDRTVQPLVGGNFEKGTIDAHLGWICLVEGSGGGGGNAWYTFIAYLGNASAGCLTIDLFWEQQERHSNLPYNNSSCWSWRKELTVRTPLIPLMW